ncbi:MAG: nickel pincer cofactor biosynthesis protein LarC [Chloroflexi bacterium AL-W]|nr:nickel pincer cofactor biosynthesis protein LarC [Chloroflexi bacterium AL-N1]NOK66273.1 nickel pincer cofactor biosynthesis protein LarC [Chloroflexi bacterium AL-N10]NOK73153.1 nickel pincer cofactor biosynthesis protein LarC [Chloroflexi bacterium AL-N5]NOK80050.1 nickel pincer cofactor biosynthesis protein LarC [Chloroflexi bacterium AL-W]NOK88095.1 nickel pincer cofactor biosynthesis protein LarC [Chloroflexi bacterium AL-N15]
MPTVIYFDCFSGISGDMALGALLDMGLSLEDLRDELNKLPVDGWEIRAERGMRAYLAGTRALVHAPEQPVHRHLADVRTIIESSTLAPGIKTQSLHVFTLLAQAEAAVHGVAIDEVHFHEVGALDAIVDIVGVVIGLHLLGVEQVYASPLPLGSGWVWAAHGQLPIPAPAVMNLVAAVQAPTVPDETPTELVTPTGAALLAGLATFRRPPLRVTHVGYGLGKRDLDRPNALRVWLGTTNKKSPLTGDHLNTLSVDDTHAHRVVLLETNIDDQSAEQLAFVVEQLFATGALDVWQTPIYMKKNRAGILLSVLVSEALEESATSLLMRETTTLGVRRRIVERSVCEREEVTVTTALGAVRVKQKLWHNQLLGAAPEYEDCRRLAQQHDLPLRHVYQLVYDAMTASDPDRRWAL